MREKERISIRSFKDGKGERMQELGIEALQKLIGLQKERKEIKELIENKRINVNGVYCDFFRENGTTESKPSYSEVVFVPCLLWIVGLIVAISSKNMKLLVWECVIVAVILAVSCCLRRKTRTRWEEIQKKYRAACAQAKVRLETEVLPALEILRATVPEECIENVAKAEELLKQIQYKSYEDGCANQKQCAFCGANNAISAYRCEVCGAPFMQ